ncbi:hypothetical protein ACFQL7_28220 [Halocatena marina]|uniref:Uncharacterized protein n=1 Tax=Halocatena marina TaxID=2934937 RepID=A0ABD5YYP8_9EURY
MYNIWRLIDVLLTTMSREIMDYTPVIIAGELADWIVIYLQLNAG